nr:amidohydrolase family protein [Myroides marinus]
MNVLVSGQTIEKISPSAISVKGSDVTKINGNGKTLMPGLIDVHVHMVFGALSMEQMMSPTATPESLMQNVAVGANNMLMRGFTSVRDAGGPIFPLKAAVDADKVAGPRI